MNDSRTRLNELLRLYADKQASPEEMQELATLLQQNWERIEPGQEASHIDWHHMLETIKAEGREIPATRHIHFLQTGWFRSAAAILLLLGAGAIFYVTRPKRQDAAQQTATPATDLLPGGNKAILTLAGGQQIILDSAHQGNLTIQGNAQVTKAASGKLAYQSMGNTTGSTSTALYNTLSTPRGGQYELTLPDGTHVWLNAASSITYPTAFTGPQREVTMTGEAYFEVTYTAKQPFRVKVGNDIVEDLGTHFNINAYGDEPTLKTTLLEGRARVNTPINSVVLKPGQQASSDPSGAISISSSIDADETIAWKNGLFQFNRADIQSVMRQIARWYDVDVRFEGPVPNDRFWGKLPRDAKASEVLQVLQKEQVHFRIEGKTIIVMK